MLVALLIAAALAADQSSPPPSTGAPSTADKAPTSEEIDALQQLYESSCGSRGYGEYDDVCMLITQQINDARGAAERAKRARAKARSTASPTPAPSPAAPKT